jgi:fatty acid desaturase
MGDPTKDETVIRPLVRAPQGVPPAADGADAADSEIGQLRRRLNEETGGGYRKHLQALTPRYGQVWRDIALGYAALVAVLVGVNMPIPLLWSAPLVLLGAVLVGYGLAYLQLFIHEAAHFNLAADRRVNDRLANVFIAWHLGADAARYRMTHLVHHRNHGAINDAERSYFNALTPRFVLEMLTGAHALRVFLARADAGPGGPRTSSLWPLARGVLAHLVLLSAMIASGAWRSAVAWVLGVGVFLPFFSTLRQLLEHRSPEANPAVDYAKRPHGAYTRIFRGGMLAHSFGGAGFDRHLLHHWEPQVSYTRLPDLEAYLRATSASEIIDRRTTTYLAALRGFLSSDRGR